MKYCISNDDWANIGVDLCRISYLALTLSIYAVTTNAAFFSLATDLFYFDDTRSTE